MHEKVVFVFPVMPDGSILLRLDTDERGHTYGDTEKVLKDNQPHEEYETNS